MIVDKFGGTSIGSAERFVSVADIILDHPGRGDGTAAPGGVVVVSAMSGVTDQPIAGARAASQGRDTAYRKSVSFCIPESQLAGTVRFLHRKLGLEHGHQTDPSHPADRTG